jgi:hypothetical protein
VKEVQSDDVDEGLMGTNHDSQFKEGYGNSLIMGCPRKMIRGIFYVISRQLLRAKIKKTM